MGAVQQHMQQLHMPVVEQQQGRGYGLDREGELESQVKQMESLFSSSGDDDEEDEDDDDDEDYEDDVDDEDDDEVEDYEDEDDDQEDDDDDDEVEVDWDNEAGGIERVSSGPGEFLQIPIEIVDELTHDEFVKKYVMTKTPVVLRRKRKNIKKNTMTLKWMRTNCDMDGEHAKIHVFDVDPSSTGWAGFDFDGKTTQPLGSFLKQLKKTNIARKKAVELKLQQQQQPAYQYGFDYRIACSCPKMLDRFPQLRYFQGDVLQVDTAYPRVHWPVLIAGPAGSSSALHVDSHFLPFYLTLMSGKKQFRVVTLNDWRNNLSPELYNSDGTVNDPFNAYDDNVVRAELLKRGANVYNVTMEVGDTIYIPTGALHGAMNLDDTSLSLSYSSNFLDMEHSKQVKKEWCLKEGKKIESGICRLLMRKKKLTKKRGGLFYGMQQKLQAWRKITQKKVSLSGDNQYSYWPWMLSHRGFCQKNAVETCPGISDRCAE